MHLYGVAVNQGDAFFEIQLGLGIAGGQGTDQKRDSSHALGMTKKFF
jgi:hypothetical protein